MLNNNNLTVIQKSYFKLFSAILFNSIVSGLSFLVAIYADVKGVWLAWVVTLVFAHGLFSGLLFLFTKSDLILNEDGLKLGKQFIA